MKVLVAAVSVSLIVLALVWLTGYLPRQATRERLPDAKRALRQAPGLDDRTGSFQHQSPATREAGGFQTAGAGDDGERPWERAVEDTVSEFERRMVQRDADLRMALGWHQVAASGSLGLCALLMVFVWGRVLRLTARRDTAAAEPTDGPDGSGKTGSCALGGAVDAEAERSIEPGDTAPRVRVASGVLDRLVEFVGESRRLRGEVETGCALVGKIVGSGASRFIVVNGLVEEGPQSTRSAGHHKADRQYQQRELELLQLVDGAVMHMGDAHLHPGDMDRCSEGDYRTDLGNVRGSHSGEMVFVIATVADGPRNGASPGCVYRGGLILSFYYLGVASGFEYCRFRPEIVQGQALRVPASLRSFARDNPLRARLDFENLRRLTAYEMAVSELPDQSGRPNLCIRMRHRSRGFNVIVLFGPDVRMAPEFLVETGGSVLTYKCSFQGDTWPDTTWFTPVVLKIEAEMVARQSTKGKGCNNAAVGKRSEPAGANSVGPREDTGHGKFPATEQGTGRADQAGDESVPVGRGGLDLRR